MVAKVRSLDEEWEMSKCELGTPRNSSKDSLGLAIRENRECVPGPMPTSMRAWRAPEMFHDFRCLLLESRGVLAGESR
jgi:hypothetical protein